jgi:hypothetical protein
MQYDRRMRATFLTVSLLAILVPAGCASPATAAPKAAAAPTPSGFPALGIGGDYLRYRKLTPAPFLSKVHGNRWVDVYVNELGADAYLDGGPIPVGTTIVKASWEGKDGAPSTVAGPTYVMRKEKPGYAPDHDDWYFAIYWAEPTPEQRAKLGGPIYWQGASPKVAYCYACHDSYDRDLGGLTPSSLLDR